MRYKLRAYIDKFSKNNVLDVSLLKNAIGQAKILVILRTSKKFRVWTYVYTFFDFVLRNTNVSRIVCKCVII